MHTTGPDFLQGLQAKLLTTEKLPKPVLKRKFASFDRSVFAALLKISITFRQHITIGLTVIDVTTVGMLLTRECWRLFVNGVHDQLEAHTNTPNLTMSCVKKLKTKDGDC